MNTFEDYYRGYTLDQLVELFTNEESGLGTGTLEAIKNLIQQKGGDLDLVLQNYYKNYSTQELFEFVIKKEKILGKEVLKAIKFNIDNKEGSQEKFIEKESTNSGKIFFTFNDVKNRGTGKINHFEGVLYLTSNKICFIPQKIKYDNSFYAYVLPVVFFGGIGKIYGILGAGLGAALGASLGEAYNYFFNKPKKVEQYNLPLTLQAAYIKDSFLIDLSNITEVLIGKKKNYIIISSEQKLISRFEIKKEYIDTLISFFEKNNIKNRPQGSLVDEYKNYKK